IEGKKYFIDVGSGWPSVILFPEFQEIEYSVFGMSFKTRIQKDDILLYHRTTKDYNLMITIPLKEKSQDEIKNEINKRFEDKSIYPFQNSLRFSKIIDDNFYFLKGNRLGVYNKNSITEKIVLLDEIYKLITDTFKFDLSDLKIDYIEQ
ncbi:arylamine N-acetyltransferase, partial [Flavobacterium sp.]|uniref:arylamine N-acetyltransferase n=1 Tax=Flavobacterium sp. TaxID=239 RepID=UPI0025C4695E